MDDIDRAQHQDAMYRRQALQQQQAHRAATSRPSATTCHECGDPIPLARQQAVPGCRRCTPCQSEIDQPPR